MGVSTLSPNVPTTKYTSRRNVGGNGILNSTTFALIADADLTLPCAVGDLIEYVPNFALASEAVYVSFDVKSINSGIYVGSGTTTPDPFGQMGWRCRSGEESYVSGSTFYKAVASDISGGNITLQMVYRTDSATNRTIYAGGSGGTSFLARMVNHGQAS